MAWTFADPARRWALAALLLVLAPVVACGDNESALARGDRLWADSSFDAALTEYRLAVAQHGDAESRLRLAHAYARTGRLDAAKAVYDDLIASHPELAAQAAYDYLALARRALRRQDEFGAASAVDAALAVDSSLSLAGAALPVARYYRDRSDPERALDYYARALTTLPPDSSPPVLFEIGLIEENRNRCDVALDYYRAFRMQAEQERNPAWRSRLGEARWHTGNCSFRLAQQAREAGDVDAALKHLDTMIGLGEPENLLDQAWFERGEMLYATGKFDEALASYRKVLERSPSRTGQLVQRAQDRIDAIRFGPAPLDTVPPTRP